MIQRYAQFDYLDEGQGIVSPPHFVYDFSIKTFLILYSTNWTNFIVWLSLLLETSVCLVVFTCLYFIVWLSLLLVCWRHKLTLSFESSRFYTWPKCQDKNLNILRTKKAFKVKLKACFIIFKGLSVAKNCLRPESAPLRSFFCMWSMISFRATIESRLMFTLLTDFLTLHPPSTLAWQWLITKTNLITDWISDGNEKYGF